MNKASHNISVIGAGLMGHGIALTFARAGHQVSVFDSVSESLQALPARVTESLEGLGADATDIESALANLRGVSKLDECVQGADFVFEAAPEKVTLKQSIFAEVESFAPATCIFASNTSVIPITSIMERVKKKSRTLGTHWWNPPHMIPLVEVIKTDETKDTSIEVMMNLLVNVGKMPVRVEKDVPGFIGNRLQHALWREAISLVENGICSAEAVDMVVKSSFGRRLAVLGPLANADLVGTDLTLDIHQNVLHDLESSNAPSPYLEQLVSSGKLGMKSGEGFQRWTTSEANELRKLVTSHLKKLETIMD